MTEIRNLNQEIFKNKLGEIIMDLNQNLENLNGKNEDYETRKWELDKSDNRGKIQLIDWIRENKIRIVTIQQIRTKLDSLYQELRGVK